MHGKLLRLANDNLKVIKTVFLDTIYRYKI